MHDLGKIVYLDMHKTGSTTTSYFLEKCCTLTERSFVKHGHLDVPKQDGVFCFTTVRNVKSLYVSLFLYGCAGKGKFARKLRNMGKEDLYQPSPDAFNAWMHQILDSDFLCTAQPFFAKFYELGFGLQSTRHIYFSLSRPMEAIADAQSMTDVIDLYHRAQVNDLIIRNETLDSALQHLALHTLPQYFDADKVAAFFADKIQYNTTDSTLKDALKGEFDPAITAKLAQQEQVLLSLYP